MSVSVPRAARLAFFAAFVLVLFWRLGAWGPLDPTEARYAEIGREMLRTGDFVHPHYLGVHHYHKPPVTYWITAASYSIFGVTVFAARFFLQIAFLLQSVLVYAIARRIYPGRDAPSVAALAWMSMLIAWISIRDLSTDAYLALCVLASTWSLIEYGRSSRAGFLYGAAVFAGLGFLTKITELPIYLGPAALAVWYRYRASWRWSGHFVAAGLLCLVVSLSWFVVLEFQGIHELSYVLYYQSLVRYTGDEFHRNQPALFYFLLAPVLGFPWVFVVGHAALRGLRRQRWRMVLDRDWNLFFVAFLLPLVFFSFSHSKLILYVLPAFPILALYVPRSLDALTERQVAFWQAAQFGFYLLVAAGLVVARGRVDGLDGSLFAWAGSVVALQILIRRRGWFAPRRRILVSALAFVLVMGAFLPGVLASSPELTRSTRPVADRIEELGLADRPIYVIDEYLPSIAFHLDRTVAIVAVRLERELQFETDDEYRRWYFALEEPGERQRWRRALQVPSVLVGRESRENRIDESFRSGFAHRERIQDWVLYY